MRPLPHCTCALPWLPVYVSHLSYMSGGGPEGVLLEFVFTTVLSGSFPSLLQKRYRCENFQCSLSLNQR